MISVLALFSFSLLMSTLYLSLLHYTRFFKHTKLSTEFTLNLNFYLLLLYLMCFILSLFCLIAEYSFKLAGQALAHTIMNEMSVPSAEPSLPTKYVDISSTESDLSTKNIGIENHKEINGSELKQKINSHINNKSQKDSSSFFPTPKEQAKQTMLGKLCKDKISEHAIKEITSNEQNPSATRIKEEFVNALTNQKSTLFKDGSHSPEELGITDPNKAGNKVPLWTASTIDNSGNKQNVVCCNAEAALDIAQAQYKHATGKNLLGKT